MSADDVLPAFEAFLGTRHCLECDEIVAAEHYNDAHEMCAGCYWSGKR